MYTNSITAAYKTVCPAVNRLSDLSELRIHSSIHELVPKAVFETARDISRKAVWELHVYLIPSLGHIIAGLSRLSAPRRAFLEEETSRYFVNYSNENHDKMSILVQLFC